MNVGFWIVEGKWKGGEAAAFDDGGKEHGVRKAGSLLDGEEKGWGN